MKKGRKFYKKQMEMALGQANRAIELATTATESLKAANITISELRTQIETLQTPVIEPYTINYHQ